MSYDRKKAWSSINHSVLSAIGISITIHVPNMSILMRLDIGNQLILTINILLFLKVRDFRILCGKIS